jgi:hypothetical protein
MQFIDYKSAASGGFASANSTAPLARSGLARRYSTAIVMFSRLTRIAGRQIREPNLIATEISLVRSAKN